MNSELKNNKFQSFSTEQELNDLDIVSICILIRRQVHTNNNLGRLIAELIKGSHAVKSQLCGFS